VRSGGTGLDGAAGAASDCDELAPVFVFAPRDAPASVGFAIGG
jgi:hypothetical protein